MVLTTVPPTTHEDVVAQWSLLGGGCNYLEEGHALQSNVKDNPPEGVTVKASVLPDLQIKALAIKLTERFVLESLSLWSKSSICIDVAFEPFTQLVGLSQVDSKPVVCRPLRSPRAPNVNS